jgi:hypothetical protein
LKRGRLSGWSWVEYFEFSMGCCSEAGWMSMAAAEVLDVISESSIATAKKVGDLANMMVLISLLCLRKCTLSSGKVN